MDKRQITLRSGKQIPAIRVRRLLRRNQWKVYLKEEDIRWYLNHAYRVITAWKGKVLVGLAVLIGDGRTYLELETLLVDKAYRRIGIGTRLMEAVMDRVVQVKPYAVKIEVFDKKAERFYGRFGFVVNRNTWLLERNTTAHMRTTW